MKDNIEDAKLDFERVKEQKLILKGDDVQDGIDYTHFNFIVHNSHDAMSDILEDVDKSAFDVLKFFWAQFYPYLEAEIQDKENLFKKFNETNQDADSTVQMGMEFKFRLDHAEALIKKTGMEKSYIARIEKARTQLREEMKRQADIENKK